MANIETVVICVEDLKTKESSRADLKRPEADASKILADAFASAKVKRKEEVADEN